VAEAPFRLAVGAAAIEIARGDITRETTEAIVNAANAQLAGGGGVDGAIHRAGGPAIMAELRERYEGCPTGSAVITAGGNLAAKYVIHAVGPRYEGDPRDAELLESAYQTCMILCAQHRIASVAFPAISTGIYGYPLAEAAPIALRTVVDRLRKQEFPTLVRFVLFDEAGLRAWRDAVHALGIAHGH